MMEQEFELRSTDTTAGTALSVIQEMAALTAAGLGMEEVVEGVYRAVSRLMDTTNFYIALYDELKQELFFCLDVTEGQRVERGPRTYRKMSGGLTEYVIQTRAPLLLEESSMERITELGVRILGITGAKSWLGVPLMIGDRVIGVMTVQSYTTPGLYGERERDLLMTVANQAAAALENARLSAQQARRMQEMLVLNEIGQALAVTHDLEEVFHTAHMQLGRLFDVSSFYIAVVDEERGIWSSAFDVQEGERLVGREYPLNEGLTGYMIRERRSLLFRTAEEELAFCREHGFEHLGQQANSWLGTPLIALNQVVGVLAIESYTQSYVFDEHDLALIQAVAVPVANAIYNARLFEQLQQQALQEQRVRVITEQIIGAADIQAVLRIVTEEVGRLMGATTAVTRLGTREQLAALAQETSAAALE